MSCASDRLQVGSAGAEDEGRNGEQLPQLALDPTTAEIESDHLPVGVASNGWVPLTAVVSNTPAIAARVVPKPFLARIVMEFGEDDALVLCGGYGHEAAKQGDASPACTHELLREL